MTEQDSNHGPGEDFAPLYPDHVYDWGNPGMRGVTAARVEARTNDLVFQEYPGTNSVILRGFPAQNVFYERISSNCSDLGGSEGLKGENWGRIPVADAQDDGCQTAFAQFDPPSLNSCD